MHPFFVAQSGDPIMSHNGATVRNTQLGTRRAFRDAFAAGYRWFQIDAVPVRDALMSAHSLTGRKRGWRRRTRASLRNDPASRALSSIEEIVLDNTAPNGWDAATRWNIEMKHGRGRDRLLDTLRTIRDQRPPDPARLERIMVSSPWRPAVLRAVAAEFPEIALAAPVQHGGVFGVSWWPWGKPVRRLGGVRLPPYDCEQVHHLFVRRRRRVTRGRPQQAWTIRSRAQLDKLIESTDAATGETTWRAWPIVDSRRLTIRPILDPGRGGPARPATQPTTLREIAAVALGGGGWRGAFGGIGTVAYLAARNVWGPKVRQVVGISGGAIAVAGLAGGVQATGGPDPANPAAAPDARPDADVGFTLRALLDRLVAASVRVTAIAAGSAFGVVAAAVGVGVLIVKLVDWWALVLAFVPLLATTLFMLRWVVVRRWLRLTQRIYDGANLPDVTPAPRRYAIGATGLNDGRLYSFTTSAGQERTRISSSRWPGGPAALGAATPLAAPAAVVPVGQWNHAEAVVRASSLPGIGPRAGSRIWLPCPPDHALDGDHTAECEWVPDRLVDGGLNGIFGRGLLLEPADVDTVLGPPAAVDDDPLQGPGVLPLLLTVDTGRALVANDAESLTDRLLWWGQRLSLIALEARWLQVAFNISYLAEMGAVFDGAEADGFRLRLVRLAETETDAWSPLVPFAQRRRDLAQERLYVLRDKVHKISLLQATRGKAYDAVVCAAVACALEFQGQPDLTGPTGILARVERQLNLPQGVLVERWNSLKVPMLGQP